MKWLLVAVGVLAFGAAVAVLATARDPDPTETSPDGPNAAADGSDGQVPDPDVATSGHDGVPDHGHAGREPGTEPGTGSEAEAGDIPLRVPLPEPPAGPLDYAAALGRPVDRSYPAPGGEGTWAWPAFPARGRFRFLVRSNLGGMEAQRWLQGAWHSEDPDRIAFADLADGDRSLGGCVVRRRGGIWKTEADGASPPGVLDVARVIASVQSAFATAGELDHGQDLRFAGMPCRLWAGDVRRALFVAPDDNGRPPSAAYPRPDRRWFDLRCWLTRAGSWQGLEYLQGSPSSPEDPGFSVRRLVLVPTGED